MKNKLTNGSSKCRPISAKRFNKIKAFLRSCYLAVKSLEEKIARFVEIVSTKSFTVAPEKKGDDPVTVNLSNTEVNGYKLDLKQAKLDRKKAQKALKKAEDEYRDACRHNAACVKEKNSKFNSNLAAEYKAKREKGVRKQKVVNMVSNLQTTDDERFTALISAVKDGYYSFRKEMDAILQQEDEDTLVTISGLSAVKTEIYRAVKDEFFVKKEDDTDSKDNNDEEDTAAAIVTAG